MNETQPSPANIATAYRVARRTERANREAERWVDGLGRYWESTSDPASVHWLKVEGLKGWYLLNDAAYYVLHWTAEETAEEKGEGELLGWDIDEVGGMETGEAYTPDLGEPVGLAPVLEAIRALNGPCWYERHEAA